MSPLLILRIIFHQQRKSFLIPFCSLMALLDLWAHRGAKPTPHKAEQNLRVPRVPYVLPRISQEDRFSAQPCLEHREGQKASSKQQRLSHPWWSINSVACLMPWDLQTPRKDLEEGALSGDPTKQRPFSFLLQTPVMVINNPLCALSRFSK